MKATSTLLPEATQNGQSEWNREWEWSLRGWKASLMSHTVKNLPAMWETRVNPWVGTIPWRREWLPAPVFWPGGFHGQRSLAGYSSWGRKQSDRAEQCSLSAPWLGGFESVFQAEVWGGGSQAGTAGLSALRQELSAQETNVLKILSTEQWRQRTSHMQNSGDLQRFSLKYLAEYFSPQVCEEITWGQRTNHSKWIEGTVLHELAIISLRLNSALGSLTNDNGAWSL